MWDGSIRILLTESVDKAKLIKTCSLKESCEYVYTYALNTFMPREVHVVHTLLRQQQLSWFQCYLQQG